MDNKGLQFCKRSHNLQRRETGTMFKSSISRSVSVRSAPADSRLSLEDDRFSPDQKSPRLKRKSAIRRQSTFTTAKNVNVDSRSGNAVSRSHSSADHNLSKSADWRAKAGSLLDVQEESFTLNIDLIGCKETVTCRVEPGTSLRYVLTKVAEEKSFDVDSVDVFVESSKTPFPIDTPTYAFARRNLHVKANKQQAKTEETPLNKQHNNDDVFGSPQRTVGPMAGIHSDGPNTTTSDEFFLDGASGGKRKDLSQFLGVSVNATPSPKGGGKDRRYSVPGVQNKGEKIDPKAFALQEKLEQFNVHGLPPFPRLLSIGDRAINHDEEIFELEETWRKIVKNVKSLDKKEQDQMEAIWEIIKTEKNYIQNIRIIIELYMCTLLNLQASSILNGIQTEKIFANIIEIEKLHITFWKDHIMTVLKKMRTERKPLTADDINTAFKDFNNLFTPYFKFCPDEGHCLDLVRSLTEEDSLFSRYLSWCENRKESNRKKLSELLVYPMQRLTKYPLLLSAVAKKTTDERSKTLIQARADEVDHFIRRINHEVTRHQEKCKLDNALTRIEGYEGASIPSGCDELSKLTEEHSFLDLAAPMPFAKAQQSRWLLYEGAMKIRDTEGRIDAYIFLFTDAFVITKPKKFDKFKVIKPPLKIDKLFVVELKDRSGFAAVCVNDHGSAAYGFVATTGNETLQKWTERISKAKELYNYACTEETDDFLDNVSISQSSEPTDTSSGLSVEVETPTGSPQPSPVPSPKTQHRRVTMFDMTPPDIPGVLMEETEEDRDGQEMRKSSQMTEKHDSTGTTPRQNGSPKRRVPPLPPVRENSTGETKKVPPPVSPKPILTQTPRPSSTPAGIPDRVGRGSLHNLRYEQNLVQTIIAFDDSDEDEKCADPPSVTDPYINPDIPLQLHGRFKKKDKVPVPSKKPSHPQKSPNNSPHRSPSHFVPHTLSKDSCKVNNHQLMQQCHVEDDSPAISQRKKPTHGENSTPNGNAAIMSHC